MSISLIQIVTFRKDNLTETFNYTDSLPSRMVSRKHLLQHLQQEGMHRIRKERCWRFKCSLGFISCSGLHLFILFIHTSIFLFISIHFIYLSIHLSIYLLIHPSVNIVIHLSIHPSIYRSIYFHFPPHFHDHHYHISLNCNTLRCTIQPT